VQNWPPQLAVLGIVDVLQLSVVYPVRISVDLSEVAAHLFACNKLGKKYEKNN
jgi:hypothetical protein